MRIPTIPDGRGAETAFQSRKALYINTLRECEVSREDRAATASSLKTAFLTGSLSAASVRYNKLKQHGMSVASALYSPESVRFSPYLPPHYHMDAYLARMPAVRDALEAVWSASDAGAVFNMGVRAAYYTDCVTFKVLTSNGAPTVALISDPGDLGVWEEISDDFVHQEALCHWYSMSLPAFWRLISGKPVSMRERLWAIAQEHRSRRPYGRDDALPPTVESLIVFSTSPTMAGEANVAGLDATMAKPQVAADVVRLAELWIWDDALADYRVVTFLLPTETIVRDTGNPLLPGEHPFYPLTLDPVPGYVWGLAPMRYLIGLQNWREKKMLSMDDRDEKQIDPPLVLLGFGNLVDNEKAKAFRKAGGTLAANNPGADVKPVIPPPIPDPLYMIDAIDRMWENMESLPTGAGARGLGPASAEDDLMAKALLSSGPTLNRAMLVERCIERVATALLRLERRRKERPLFTTEGERFYLSQMPAALAARVWAHSASPIFAQQIMSKALAARQTGDITGEDFLEFLNLPGLDLLRPKARRIAEAQAEHQDKVMQVAKLKALKK